MLCQLSYESKKQHIRSSQMEYAYGFIFYLTNVSRVGVEPTKSEMADLQSACFSHLHTSTFRERMDFHQRPHDYQSSALITELRSPEITPHESNCTCCRGWNRTIDPKVMSLVRYYCATLRFRGHRTPQGGTPRFLQPHGFNY